jgi:hypothetical protein
MSSLEFLLAKVMGFMHRGLKWLTFGKILFNIVFVGIWFSGGIIK